MIAPKKPLYKVFNQRLAGWLMQNGFPLIELIDEDERKRSFVFCDTPELHDAIQYRHEEIQKNKNVYQIRYRGQIRK